MSNLREAVGGAVSAIDSASNLLKDVSNIPLLGNKGLSLGSGDGKIEQTERAFTVRPRSTPISNSARYTADRGPFSSIKLISQTKSKQDILGDASGRDSASNQAVSEVLDALLSEGGYSDFLLTNVDASFNEKIQVNEVFGDSEVVYYFGRSPIQFNLSGVVFDDVDNNWFYKFVVSYFSLLRGTQMAKNYQLARINLPNMTLVGTIMGISYSQDASRDTDIRFTMQFLAKSITPRHSLVPSEMLTNDALKIDLENASSMERFTERAEINSLKTKINDAKAFLGSTIGAAGSKAEEIINGVGSTISGVIGEVRGFFSEATSGLLSIAELRANLIAPIYGVLTTLTKVVKSVTGDILSLINGPGAFVQGILKDVQSIANEAIALVNAIEGSIDSIIGAFEDSANDLRRTIQSIRNTAGAIARAPENISNIFKRLSRGGKKKGYIASLRSGRVSRAKQALINSGTAYTPSSGATLQG